MTPLLGQDTLRDMFLSGQRRWPALSLEFAVFAEHCQRVLDADNGLPLEPTDLFLCCACAQAQPEALRSFELECGAVAAAAIRRVDGSDDFVRDTLQDLWGKLLLGEDAKVRSYSGRGALQAWVRVAATRAALDRRRSNKRSGARQVELTERLAAADVNIEATLLKARFGQAFQDALRVAVGGLSRQERNVLRMHVVGQCSIDEIGRAYNVHRATAARWIERSRSKIYDEVLAALCVRHQLTASEFHSLATLMGEELQLSLGFGSAPTSAAG
ncbi:MAG: sigma factor-like helix-turn-helix DNA-binding protein [Myxococcales bacterium]